MGRWRGVELSDLILSGDRLLLRPWRADDAARVHAVMQDASMGEFLALPAPYTRSDADEFVTRLGDEGRAEGNGVGSAVVEASSGRVVGSAALRLTGDPEIGYWIAPGSRGLGYATEAVRLLAAWGFGLGLRRVRVACDVRNVASARVALGAGFGFEGIGRDGVTGGGLGGVPERRGDLARFARLAGDSDGPIAPAFAALPAGGLSDGVLALRVLAPGDERALLECDDEVAVRWGFTGVAGSAERVRAECHRAGLDRLVGARLPMAMIDVATGGFAGLLGLRLAGPPQVGGIGYAVHPAFRGRGFTARALRLLIPWAFEMAGFARLELGAKAGNVASQRAAGAAGFEPDGVRRARLRRPDGDGFDDEVRFALVSPRYR